MTVYVSLNGLDQFVELVAEFPERTRKAATLAVNDAARFGQRLGSKEIRKQVGFTARYLGSATDGANARLGITKLARGEDTEAVIRGRERPTSLARFVTGSKSLGRRSAGNPVRVEVDPGKTKALPGAWLMKLRAGRALDDDSFNVGLAIRLKPGQKINKREFADVYGDYNMSRNGRVLMLYGPSVAQVFRDVAQDIEGPVADKLQDEFVRQWERLE